MTMTTMTNTDLLEIIENKFTSNELSIDPTTLGDELENQELSDEFLTITVGDNMINVGFDLSVELNVVNSGGDGWNDDNFDYVDGVELDVTITSIESVETNDIFDLKADGLEKVLETLVMNEIDENL